MCSSCQPAIRSDGAPIALESPSPSDTPIPYYRYSMGEEGLCLLNEERIPVCWGELYSLNGIGSYEGSSTPTAYPDYGGYTRLSHSSWGLGCGITVDRDLECWGDQYAGQVGNGVTDSSFLTLPVKLDSLTNVVDVSANHDFACAVSGGGDLYCWGSNSNGKLGVDSLSASFSTPQRVVTGEQGHASGFLAGVASVSVGDSHACARTVTGSVYCWGWNTHGQAGDGTNTTPRRSPRAVSGLSGVVQLGIQGSASCALKNDGTVWCWGYGSDGQLGNGSDSHQNVPVQVVGVGGTGHLTGIAALADARSSTHLCAISQTGTLYCWGFGGYGALGNSSLSSTNTPVPFKGIGGIGILADVIWAGVGYHTCAYSASAGLICAGPNYAGQLAFGDADYSDYTYYSDPVAVAVP